MTPSETSSTPITRRRLAALTAAGGSTFVLAACGTNADPNKDSSDTDLAQLIATAQKDVSTAYANKAGPDTASFKKQSDALLQELIRAAGGTVAGSPSTASNTPEQAESALISATNAAVADVDGGTLRELAYRVSASAAGRLAALNVGAGKDAAPTAFVLGEESS